MVAEATATQADPAPAAGGRRRSTTTTPDVATRHHVSTFHLFGTIGPRRVIEGCFVFFYGRGRIGLTRCGIDTSVWHMRLHYTQFSTIDSAAFLLRHGCIALAWKTAFCFTSRKTCEACPCLHTASTGTSMAPSRLLDDYSEQLKTAAQGSCRCSLDLSAQGVSLDGWNRLLVFSRWFFRLRILRRSSGHDKKALCPRSPPLAARGWPDVVAGNRCDYSALWRSQMMTSIDVLGMGMDKVASGSAVCASRKETAECVAVICAKQIPKCKRCVDSHRFGNGVFLPLFHPHA